MTKQQPPRAEQIRARLAQLADVESPLSARIDELRQQIADHAMEVRKRDWVLTGKRERGVSTTESHDVAKRQRDHHYTQQLAIDKALRDVVKEQSTVSREASALRNELQHLEQIMTTPASLDERINGQRETVASLEAERVPLAQALQQAVDRNAQIEAAEQRATESAEALEQARAQFFLAGEDDTSKRDAVDTAEAEAATSREHASNARAARSAVAQAIKHARTAIDAHDAAEGGARNQLERLTRQRAALVERLAIIEAADGLGAALARLVAVSPEMGCALLQALRYDGLHILDAAGRPERPKWLQQSFDGRGKYLAEGLTHAP